MYITLSSFHLYIKLYRADHCLKHFKLFFNLIIYLDDLFAIDEVTMYEGENHSDACYAVAGDILDGYLYDLFMTMLGKLADLPLSSVQQLTQ